MAFRFAAFMTPPFLKTALESISRPLVATGPIGQQEGGPSPNGSPPGTPAIPTPPARNKKQASGSPKSPSAAKSAARSSPIEDPPEDPAKSARSSARKPPRSLPVSSPRRSPRRSLRKPSQSPYGSSDGSPARKSAGAKEVPRSTAPSARDRIRIGRIRKQWPDGMRSSSRGLANLGRGNFCYRNSMLQCLFHQPAFYWYLHDVHPIAHFPESHLVRQCTVCALQELVTEYWHGKPDTLPPPPGGPYDELVALNEALLHNVPKGHSLEEDFAKQDQSDPFDFLKFVLDCCKEKEAVDQRKYLAAGDLDNQGKPGIEVLFDITLERQWTCIDCGHVTVREVTAGEAGHGVGLEVNLQEPTRDLSLVEYLRSNVFTEELKIQCTEGTCKPDIEGDDKLDPEVKGKLRQQRKAITKSPEILVIRLKRFAQQPFRVGRPWTPIKIRNRCAFEEYLNLGEFTNLQNKPLMYRLDGVVAHSGGVSSGHYIAAVRETGGKSFCSINDDKAFGRQQTGTIEELERPLSLSTKFDPYVLVYSKI